MPCVLPDGLTVAQFGQALAPANLSARQAKAMGLLMSGTCGRHGSTLSDAVALNEYMVSRLRQSMDSLGSILYKLTWKTRTTPHGRPDLCSAGVGAPHIRQRLHWMGKSDRAGWIARGIAATSAGYGHTVESTGNVGVIHDANGRRRRQDGFDITENIRTNIEQSANWNSRPSAHGVAMGDTNVAGSQGWIERGDGPNKRFIGAAGMDGSAWSACDWLPCIDGKSRPVEPGTFPLAHGVPGRVGALRGYGNAINPHVAAEFIKVTM